MKAVKKILVRLLYALILFVVCNFIYSRWFYQKDIARYSRVRNQIDTAFAQGEIIYLGESSNTSFNPWTDTLNQSISDFIQLYLPNRKVSAVTHESFHPGLFLEMLNLMPDYSWSKKRPTVVITMNMRTCGPSASNSPNEAANRQEALFYSNRPPLLTRIFLSLHFYDNLNANERTRLKFKQWRKESLALPGKATTAPTTKLWLDELAKSQRSPEWKKMAEDFVKEFAFVLDENNARVKDLEAIVKVCKEKNLGLIFHLLPENREYAQLLFGDALVNLMDYNAGFLVKYFKEKGVTVVDNYMISKGNQYTDQWYPTEHLNSELRQSIAQNIAKAISNNIPVDLRLKSNNFPNWKIKQPMADSMLRAAGVWKYLK